MNIIKRSQLSAFVILFFCITSAVHANKFLDAAQVQVDKVVNKKPIHKPSLEFKQAVARYIKNTDITCFQNIQRSSDENIAYKKELRYLFKNYGKFSAITLLSRLRSAHQAMVKQDSNVDGDAYQQYEQICSTLLLTVSQVFCNEMRNQILYALHDIDNLLVYWNYQHNHQVYYFFHKSPIKWIIGKEQAKEVAHNIHKLERKQSELYTLLGSLTEHLYSFTAIETTYQDCYVWIEQLFEIAADIKIPSQYTADESSFDELAAVLELKLKRVGKFKADCLASIMNAKKPNRFVRNWVLYSTALAAMAYMAHYNSKNPEVIPSACKAVQDEASKFLILLLHPLQKIYERGKLAFSMEKKVDEVKKQMNDKKLDDKPAGSLNQKKPDKEKNLKELGSELIEIVGVIDSDIAKELEKNLTTLRQDALGSLDDVIKTMQNPGDGYIYSSSYEVNADEIRKDMNAIKVKIERITENKKVVNEQEAQNYDEALIRIYSAMDNLSAQLSTNATGIELKAQLLLTKKYLMVVDQILEPLQKYTVIIDKIVRLFQLAAFIIEKSTCEADQLLKLAEQQLKDHELTLMFTSLIPLGITALAGSKAYQWATTRDYSSIRIALSDVNALLIESANHLDDHDYGKLVYLICKLRHKSTYLKDSLANEFLGDVAKLESKQYSAQIKHEIVENMFNKYAFLGKVTI